MICVHAQFTEEKASSFRRSLREQFFVCCVFTKQKQEHQPLHHRLSRQGTTRSRLNHLRTRVITIQTPLNASETIYVCTQSSQWAPAHEVLVLRCVNGTWTAYDRAVNADCDILQSREADFYWHATKITQPGRHQWETNHVADPSALRSSTRSIS